MVLFFSSTAVDPPAVIYMGRDKVENEDLIKYATPNDVWFHVDKLSSAHVYIRMPDNMNWEAIPEALVTDCAQLVKANSIQGIASLLLSKLDLVQETKRTMLQSSTRLLTTSRCVHLFTFLFFPSKTSRKQETWMSAKCPSTMTNS